MKVARILLSMGLVLAMMLPLKAEDKPARRGQLSPVSQAMMRMQGLHKALEGLELTDDQEAAVKKMHEELGPKMKANFEKIGAILTEDQREKAEAAAKEAKEAGKEGRAFFMALESSVELTEEQQAKMADLGKELQAFQREVMKKSLSILTDEQKEQLKAKMAPARGKGKGKGKGKKKAE